jgi:hypothetical protein
MKRVKLVVSVFLLICGVMPVSWTNASETDTDATEIAVETSEEVASDESGEGADSSDGAPSETEGVPSETEGDDEDLSDEEKQARFDARLDALLSEAAEADAYGKPEHCLYRRKYRDIDIINDNLLIFSKGNKYWVNELKHRCVGLRRDMVLHSVLTGISSLCSNDLIYANRRFDMNQGFMPSGRPVMVRATCTLGDFKPISEAYAQSLRSLEK